MNHCIGQKNTTSQSGHHFCGFTVVNHFESVHLFHYSLAALTFTDVWEIDLWRETQCSVVLLIQRPFKYLPESFSLRNYSVFPGNILDIFSYGTGRFGEARFCLYSPKCVWKWETEEIAFYLTVYLCAIIENLWTLSTLRCKFKACSGGQILIWLYVSLSNRI